MVHNLNFLSRTSKSFRFRNYKNLRKSTTFRCFYEVSLVIAKKLMDQASFSMSREYQCNTLKIREIISWDFYTSPTRSNRTESKANRVSSFLGFDFFLVPLFPRGLKNRKVFHSEKSASSVVVSSQKYSAVLCNTLQKYTAHTFLVS